MLIRTQNIGEEQNEQTWKMAWMLEMPRVFYQKYKQVITGKFESKITLLKLINYIHSCSQLCGHHYSFAMDREISEPDPNKVNAYTHLELKKPRLNVITNLPDYLV